jgi:hypothetical protein
VREKRFPRSPEKTRKFAKSWRQKGPLADARLRGDTRGGHGVREELAAAIGPRCHWRAAGARLSATCARWFSLSSIRSCILQAAKQAHSDGRNRPNRARRTSDLPALSIYSVACSCSCWPGQIFRREAISRLILKHAPIGDNEDDYDMLADGVGAFSCRKQRRTIGNGCGPSPMAITKTARRPAAMSRRMRLRWRHSRRVGGWPSMGNLLHRRRGSVSPMRTAMLVLCLVALAAPSQAAQRTKPSKAPDDMATRAQMCRAIVGREVPEATDGRSHEGQLNVQRFSDCWKASRHPMS